MNNLLSGVIGAIIATILSSLISIWLFKKQMRHESNRYFLQELLKNIQEIYLCSQSNKSISEDCINDLSAFQIISFTEMQKLHSDIDTLKNAIFEYNNRQAKLLQSTTLTQEVIQAKKSIDTSISNLMGKIKDIT